MSTYDIILDNVETVLHSLIEHKNPEDYDNIVKLIKIIEVVTG